MYSTSPIDRKSKRDKESRKAEKRRLQEEEDARVVAELSVYSATDNPFHDTNLGQQFKWHKKAEKEKKLGMTPEEARRKDELRRLEAKVRTASGSLPCSSYLIWTPHRKNSSA